MEQELFSKEAVIAAIRLTAHGTAGVMPREEAEKILESLPEDLATTVMVETVAACKAKIAAKAKAMAKVFNTFADDLGVK